MADKLIRGTSFDGSIRMFVADTTCIANEAQKFHKTSPVATAALGRSLTAASIMGAMLKSDNDSISLQFKGNGPIELVYATGNSASEVRGYVANGNVDLPLNTHGKLDVGGAIGKGELIIIRDFGLKSPYIGRIPLVSGEIAEDLTYYYAQSEQIPTAIGLGVLVDTDGSVIHSGGFFLQLMPEATEETAEKLENEIKRVPSITNMMRDGLTPRDIMLEIAGQFGILIDNNEIQPLYKCNCSREKMEKAIISLGTEQIQEIIDTDGKAQLSCHFCDKVHDFSKADLVKILKEAK